MDGDAFTAFLGQVPRLTAEQSDTLRRLLERPAEGEAVRELLEGRGGTDRACPHCGGTNLGAWGRARGLARFRCRGCQRTFNALTGTPLARLRQRDRWLTQAQALQDAASLRETASRCGVALSTAFRWRHRFLQAGQAPPAAGLDGIVEADETFVRRSDKGARLWKARKPDASPAPRPKARRRGVRTGRRGTDLDELVPVLVVRDRQGTTHSTVLPDLTAASIGDVLVPLLGPEVVLCSDKARAYGVLARDGGLHHEPVNIAAGERVREGVFHIQNVNAYDSRLQQWMRGWHGVATRYLGSYLGWHRMADRLGYTSTDQAILLNAL